MLAQVQHVWFCLHKTKPRLHVPVTRANVEQVSRHNAGRNACLQSVLANRLSFVKSYMQEGNDVLQRHRAPKVSEAFQHRNQT